MIKEITSCQFPKLTDEEFNILINILHEVDYNAKQFLNTSYLMSTCHFIFNTDHCKHEAFVNLHHKLRETAMRKALRVPFQKEAE